MDINENSEAYHTGYEAHSQNASITANPYVLGTWDSDNWIAGYVDEGLFIYEQYGPVKQA